MKKYSADITQKATYCYLLFLISSKTARHHMKSPARLRSYSSALFCNFLIFFFFSPPSTNSLGVYLSCIRLLIDLQHFHRVISELLLLFNCFICSSLPRSVWSSMFCRHRICTIRPMTNGAPLLSTNAYCLLVSSGTARPLS